MATEQDPSVELELRSELVERETEIARLRNLLLARDVELGAARGRLARLEQRARRFDSVAGRIPIRGPGRAIGLLSRWLWG